MSTSTSLFLFWRAKILKLLALPESVLKIVHTAGQPLPPTKRAGQPLPLTKRAGQPLPPTKRAGQPLPPTKRAGQPLPPTKRAGQPLPPTKRAGQEPNNTVPLKVPEDRTYQLMINIAKQDSWKTHTTNALCAINRLLSNLWIEIKPIDSYYLWPEWENQYLIRRRRRRRRRMPNAKHLLI